jgi:hypothetical protein
MFLSEVQPELKEFFRLARCCVQPGMDDIEHEAILAEGLDPNDPAVCAALDLCQVGAINAHPKRVTWSCG